MTNATSVSVSSSITGATGSVGTSVKCRSITTHQDVVVLASDSTKPPIPIAIHSPMAHLTLQTGTSTKDRDCLGLKCIFDSGAALSTANFHFMEAVIWQFSHILKKIYLSEDYAAIVLSGIINTPDLAPVTTEFTVKFDIHLPYSTKDGNTTFSPGRRGGLMLLLILFLVFPSSWQWVWLPTLSTTFARQRICSVSHFPLISSMQQNQSLYSRAVLITCNVLGETLPLFSRFLVCSGLITTRVAMVNCLISSADPRG
jgi:hypothetical protein